MALRQGSDHGIIPESSELMFIPKSGDLICSVFGASGEAEPTRRRMFSLAVLDDVSLWLTAPFIIYIFNCFPSEELKKEKPSS